MSFLTPGQRSLLESAVKKARKFSESGAKNALQTLAVNSPEPFAHMSPEQRSLRNRLRSKGRLLGDELSTGGPQEIKHLSVELAYDYWHKMLFARFLEANGLLIYSGGVAVSLDECEELAKSEGYPDKWTAAAHYASAMLPAIFRPQDSLMQVEFAAEDRIKLETILDDIETSIFLGDDSLGWVYQFWQSDAKEVINRSGDKINGEKLPAVTQLFTEPYMVHFLIDNTIGAWWVSRHPGEKPPVNFEYLRLHDDGTPAAGKFEGWPEKAADITMLDPCMGSGHFVVSVYQVLTRLRMFEENLTKDEASNRVITDNLHGLEIDPRCTQIAAFNLAMAAWKVCGHYIELPEMNLACSGIAPLGKKEDWVRLVGKVQKADDKERLENGMRVLYDHFQLAPELGSLLDPSSIKADAFTASFDELQPVLLKALVEEKDKDLLERGVIAAGIAKAGEILSQKYTLQITNVPYLSRGKQSELIQKYCSRFFPDSKSDLATVFLNRMEHLATKKGVVCSVTPQSWLTQKTYMDFRENINKQCTINFLIQLGEKAFSSPQAAGAFPVLFSFTNSPSDSSKSYFAFDCSIIDNINDKQGALRTNLINYIPINDINLTPGQILRLEKLSISKNLIQLSKIANSYQGIKTGDDSKYRPYYWEIKYEHNSDWRLCYGGFPNTTNHGSCYVLYWKNNGHEFARLQGLKAFSKQGFYLTNIRKVIGNLYYGYPFTSLVTALIPKDNKNFAGLYLFIKSGKFEEELRKNDKSLAVSTSSFVNIYFDEVFWQNKVEKEFKFDFPKPESNDPIQWIFHGNPIKSEKPLQVATARLLGYRWPAETDAEMELAKEARILIEEIGRFDYLADEDGIICLPSVNNEVSLNERLREYLQTVFGNKYANSTIAELLEKEGSKKNSLEDLFRDEFFDQHCKLFLNRPFIWHIWDGRKDGFSALVNYHKLTRENLRKLIYTYLGDWIRQCEFKNKIGESGSEGLLSAALKLKVKLEIILEGESPYDIFVRWKPIEKQSIGWDPDLNDGVRLNIRPFITADILRKKPNIKWGIDRGKNPPGSPWGEIRDNDRHLTLEEKRKAREK